MQILERVGLVITLFKEITIPSVCAFVSRDTQATDFRIRVERVDRWFAGIYAFILHDCEVGDCSEDCGDLYSSRA